MLKVFNTSLTSGQVATLNNNGNPLAQASAPEPATLALVLPAVVSCFVGARRRRRDSDR